MPINCSSDDKPVTFRPTIRHGLLPFSGVVASSSTRLPTVGDMSAHMTFILLMATLVTVAGTVLPLQKEVKLHPDLEIVTARDHARRAGTGWAFNLSGDVSIVGLYSTVISLGSPPQHFKVDIDTGSSFPWVRCADLGVKLNSYNISLSPTGSELACSDRETCSCSDKSNTCGYTMTYGDRSTTSGHIVTDLFHLEPIDKASTNSSFRFLFGCSSAISGNVANPYLSLDGLLGFAPGDDSVIQQLSSRGLTRKVFSHCLRGDDEGGGQLVLAEAVHPSTVYSPLIPSQSFYIINLEGLSVNGRLLTTPFNTRKTTEVLIDSGTTLAYFIEDIYNPLIDAMTSLVPPRLNASTGDGKLCYDMTTSDIKLFPQLTLQFAGGSSMIIKPKDYFRKETDLFTSSSSWCIGIRKTTNDGLSILGDLFLRDKIVVYDLDQQRLGWSAEFDCSLRLEVSISEQRSSSSRLGIDVSAILFISILVIFFL